MFIEKYRHTFIFFLKNKFNISKMKQYDNNLDASEHYHEIEYGEGGVAKAKEIIINKIGFNESSADYLVSQSEKFAIWLADSILKKEMKQSYGGTYEDKDGTFGYDFIKIDNDKVAKKSVIEWQKNQPNWIRTRYSTQIREILDWLQHPVTPKQELKTLSFDEALEKSKQWHDELQVLGGDIDFVEPEKNSILKEYPIDSDGVKYYWVFIPSNYCDLESSRMGHCGRTGYGNTLISLRSVKPYGKGHTLSDSHVTIAYGSNGLFYQVKGKKNQKPAEKYKYYIFDLIKEMLTDEELKHKFNEDKTFTGFGSEYGNEEDYGFEDMTKEQLRELYEINPAIFNDVESVLAIYDAGIITDLELQTEYKINEPNSIFSSFGNQIKLFDRGIIENKPSTIINVSKDCEDASDLLDIDRDTRDDIVEIVLCGDTNELWDNWSYWYENASDLIDNLNKENEQIVIDEIARITGLDESVVKENGIAYYLDGEDEEFDKDSFDNIQRALADAQESADQNDYYNYLKGEIESSFENYGKVISLNDEGVEIEFDLLDFMDEQDIIDFMENMETDSLDDVFSEALADGTINKPSLNLDNRYSAYGSREDFNDAFEINNYARGGGVGSKDNKFLVQAILKDNDKSVYEETFENIDEAIFKAYEIQDGWTDDSYYSLINKKDLKYWADKYEDILQKRIYIKGKNDWYFVKENSFWIAKDYESGNIIIVKVVDGKLESKSDIPKTVISQILELEKSEKYAKGGGVGNRSGNVSSIEKRVQEVNRLIELGNANNILVIDSSSTWEAPMKYKPIKYSNGILYVEYQELDLYNHLKKGVDNWITKKEKTLKRNMEFDNPLNEIAKMYRKALKQADVKYENGGEIVDTLYNNLVNYVKEQKYKKHEKYFLETIKMYFKQDRDFKSFPMENENLELNDFMDYVVEMENDEHLKYIIITIEKFKKKYGYTEEDLYAKGGGVGKERFNLSFNYNPSNLSNEDAEKIVEQYTKDWKHDNDWDNVSFYVFNLTKEKADELKSELKMEDTFNIEIEKSRNSFAKGGGVEGKSKKDRIIDYYYENYVIKNPKDFRLTKKDLKDKEKVFDAIIKYYNLDNAKSVREQFEFIFEDEDLVKDKKSSEKEYNIQVWETQEDREYGESFIAEILSNKKEAISRAEQIYYDNNYKAIEVVDENGKTLFHLSSDDDDDYAKGGGVYDEDWIEESLINLQDTVNDDNLIVDNSNYTSYTATNGSDEYLVFKTEDNAREVAIERVKEDLTENPQYFNKNWLSEYVDGESFFTDMYNEWNKGYVNDIESEDSDKYANRLIEEMVDNGIVSREEAKEDDFDAEYYKNDYAELLTSNQIDEGNGGLDHYISNFGEEEAFKVVLNNNLINVEDASENAIDTDGIAHFISSYDGKQINLSNGHVAYRIN